VCPLSCILAPFGGVFVEIHTSHCACVHYKQSKFGSNQSIIKGTLLEEQFAFSAVFRCSLEGFS
jgi:hypothetical protein